MIFVDPNVRVCYIWYAKKIAIIVGVCKEIINLNNLKNNDLKIYCFTDS